MLVECGYDPKVVQRRLMESKVNEVRAEVEREERPRMKRTAEKAFSGSASQSGTEAQKRSKTPRAETSRSKSKSKLSAAPISSTSASRPPAGPFTFSLNASDNTGDERMRALRGELYKHELPEETRRALERRFLEIFGGDGAGAGRNGTGEEERVGEVEHGLRKMTIQ
ncbi:hypothetical protein BT69DRAFT_1280888 [Atractiella rhizophila]|nr:hypothetical protein BT69DRAFT_1287401 [Atractiella rhizophila]KAH8924110.1 hypothetical protein BT69DRAFT_1280888 [Atractiella rhizophila]